MRSRIWGPLALGGVLLSSAVHAETCKNLVLYDNGSSKGLMEESTRSFPEAPEWAANWGDFNNLKSPYIRLSGMRNYRSDWTGSLIFDALPVTVHGGSLKLKARSTQTGHLGVWLSGPGGNGKISFHSLEAGKTHVLDIPISTLMAESSVEVDKVGIGLFGVPANQHTTLFVDDISMTCVQENHPVENPATADSSESYSPYVFVDVNPASVERVGLFDDSFDRRVKSRYSASQKDSLKNKMSAMFLIPEESQMRILNFKEAKNMSARDSWRGWYNSLFLVEKGSIVEGAIPNSKRIFDEAGILAASHENTVLPLLVANIDYGVSYCIDSLCGKQEVEDYHLVLVGLSAPYVTSSKIRVVYDPYFTITPSGQLPVVELCSGSKCFELKPKSEGSLEFESAGIQEITVKIHSDNQIYEQKLFVEVK